VQNRCLTLAIEPWNVRQGGLWRATSHQLNNLREVRPARGIPPARGPGMGQVRGRWPSETQTQAISTMYLLCSAESLRRPVNSSMKARGWGSVFGKARQRTGRGKCLVVECRWCLALAVVFRNAPDADFLPPPKILQYKQRLRVTVRVTLRLRVPQVTGYVTVRPPLEGRNHVTTS
jgi:hypothetical protein